MVYKEEKDPLTGKGKRHTAAAQSIEESKTTIVPAYILDAQLQAQHLSELIPPYEDETDKIALERFPIDMLKKVGAGSDRVVYDLGDGNVIKIAKNARGLLQNSYETPDFYLADLLPEVKEVGADYVVVEKVDIDRKKAREFLKPLQEFTPKEFEEKSGDLQKAFEKLNISELLNYDILFGDLKRANNWGFRKGKPVLLDMGTLNRDILRKESKNEFIPEWKIVLMERRKWKREHRQTFKY